MTMRRKGRAIPPQYKSDDMAAISIGLTAIGLIALLLAALGLALQGVH